MNDIDTKASDPYGQYRYTGPTLKALQASGKVSTKRKEALEDATRIRIPDMYSGEDS